MNLWVDERYGKPYKSYFSEDAIDKPFDMIKESSKVIETEFNKPIVMTKNDHKDFKNYTKWDDNKSYHWK